MEIMVAGRIWRPSESPKRPASLNPAPASLPANASVTNTHNTFTPFQAAL